MSADPFDFGFASKQDQQRRWAREAMEALSGVERCALACAPRPEPPTAAELAAMEEEAICEARRHRPFPANYHD